jgi:hypothetical protein
MRTSGIWNAWFRLLPGTLGARSRSVSSIRPSELANGTVPMLGRSVSRELADDTTTGSIVPTAVIGLCSFCNIGLDGALTRSAPAFRLRRDSLEGIRRAGRGAAPRRAKQPMFREKTADEGSVFRCSRV